MMAPLTPLPGAATLTVKVGDFNAVYTGPLNGPLLMEVWAA